MWQARAEMTHDPRHGSENVYRIVQRLGSIESMVDSLMSLPPAACECVSCLQARGQPCKAMSAWLAQLTS